MTNDRQRRVVFRFYRVETISGASSASCRIRSKTSFTQKTERSVKLSAYIRLLSILMREAAPRFFSMFASL